MSLATPVAYYSCEDTSGTDATGNGNTLTANGTVTNNTGKVANNVELTGAVADRLGRLSTANLSMGDIDFTIDFWIYLDTKGAQRYAVSKWTDSGTQEYSILYNNTGDRFEFYIANFAKVVAATTFGSPSIATWYYIACYHDAAADSIGISVNNGAFNTAATAGSFPGLNSQQFAIGAPKGGSNNSGTLDGRLDEVSIWKEKLAAGDFTTRYNAGAGTSYADITAAAGGQPMALRYSSMQTGARRFGRGIV